VIPSTSHDRRAESDPSHSAIDRDAWIQLAAVQGVGDARFAALLARHGSPQRVLRLARDGGLRPSFELPADVIGRMAEAARSPHVLWSRLRALGVWTATPLDTDYPERLLSLDPPPPVLYGIGERDALVTPRQVALVGTRRPTLRGRAFAAAVATRLVECSAVVVSGLAVGIDGAGHAATLDAGGRTVAVIGGGHARPGPTAHRSLARRILERDGALVGELPPDALPTKGTFPRRNRIIAALSDAVVVIEAPARSGALITAHLALEAGLPVLAAPGRPGDPATAGCLALLRETPARPLVGLDEMVVDLGYAAEGGRQAGPTGPRPLDTETAISLLSPAEAAIARAVVAGATSVDELALRSGLAAQVVAGAVTLLQLRGWVRSFGPGLLPAGPLLVAGRAPGAVHRARA
jgi:DNA processing protein